MSEEDSVCMLHVGVSLCMCAYIYNVCAYICESVCVLCMLEFLSLSLCVHIQCICMYLGISVYV